VQGWGKKNLTLVDPGKATNKKATLWEIIIKAQLGGRRREGRRRKKYRERSERTGAKTERDSRTKIKGTALPGEIRAPMEKDTVEEKKPPQESRNAPRLKNTTRRAAKDWG